MTDLYATLGLDPNATPEQIETAYRRLARQYHPDVNPSPEAAARMREINAAYRELRDPERRAAYDRNRVMTRRGATAEKAAAWEQFATWEAQRKGTAATPAPATPSTWAMPAVSMPLIVGIVLIVLLAGVALVFNAGRQTTQVAPSPTPALVAQAQVAPPTPAPPTLLPPPTITAPSGQTSAGRQSVALAASEPTLTPTLARTVTPRPTGTASPTPAPTETATATAAATVVRAVPPPLAITASDFYNEQETRAGGRKFQLKLTILNQSNTALTPPWRPRFLVMAGDRQKGWVQADYYGADKGGVDIAQQRPIRPGETQAWSWFFVTAGPDEWIRQVEFVGLGWRWVWTFDRGFLNPQMTVARSQ